jgi:hypothetical protein
MHWTRKFARSLLLLMPALALAMPAFATVGRDPKLSDSQEAGSVIVFPKFMKGTVALPEGGTAPASELEIGIVCPVGVVCAEHQSVKIRFHWVCPGFQTFESGLVCKEQDFDVTGSVYEKLVLVPNGQGTTDGVGTRFVPPPPCPQGYLIGWVIRPSDDLPIKFDGLIGDAVLRVTGTSLASYSAIPIQADPALANMAAISLVNDRVQGSLAFDGGPGHYLAVSGRIVGDVRYSNVTGPTTFANTYITLLTLDTISARPNNPTFVNLWFSGGFNSAIGVENVLSSSTEFICWGEPRIDTAIDPALISAFMGRKGVVISGLAQKVPFAGIDDKYGPVTLLGLIETTEGGTAGAPFSRYYITEVTNDSIPVPTLFEP